MWKHGHAPERHIYFSSGPDCVGDLFLNKFDKFSSKYISSTIVHSESHDGLNVESMEVLHDENYPKSFYQAVFQQILTSLPCITIDFYIKLSINTSCSIHRIDSGTEDLYMTEFFHEPDFLNLTSYQVHRLNKSDISEINNFWLNDV